MKKIIATVLTLLALAWPFRPAYAEQPKFTKDWKDFRFYAPVLSGPAFGYGYDFVGGENLLMAETKLVDYQGVAFLTFGGAFEASNNGQSELKQDDERNFFDGVPYLGLHTEFELWKILHVGGFYARDFDLKKNLAGIKTNFQLSF